MPACVTPRGLPRSPKGSLVCMCTKCTFLHIYMPCSAGRGSFLAHSAAGYAGDPRVHRGASVGPGRAPWHALWTFNVARSSRYARDRFPPRHSQPGPWNPPKMLFLFIFSPLLLFLNHHSSSRQRLGSHGTTATLQASLCDSHERCFCVCVLSVPVCACVLMQGSCSSRNQTHNRKKREVQFSFLLCCLLLPLFACIKP